MNRTMLRLLLLLVLTVSSSACLDSSQQEGEPCGDAYDACADGLVCQDQECKTRARIELTSECNEACDRVLNTCQQNFYSCAENCEQTLEDWTDEEAKETFLDCLKGEGEAAASCAQLDPDTGPSFCYQRVPLDARRRALCDALTERAEAYATDAASESPYAPLSELELHCYVSARTLTASDFSARVDPCVETEATEMTPAEVIACLNAQFELEPPEALEVDAQATSLGPLPVQP